MYPRGRQNLQVWDTPTLPCEILLILLVWPTPFLSLLCLVPCGESKGAYTCMSVCLHASWYFSRASGCWHPPISYACKGQGQAHALMQHEQQHTASAAKQCGHVKHERSPATYFLAAVLFCSVSLLDESMTEYSWQSWRHSCECVTAIALSM